ncbi:Heat shock protein HspQ [Methylobacterium aerolatum]|nr:Heat shock protein HspQ [Methylobacterium aerolatum]
MAANEPAPAERHGDIVRRRAYLSGRTERDMTDTTLKTAKFGIGAIVRHRLYPFRGIVFDVDPVFDNTEEWWLAIPEEVRPRKDQPFYHLLAENAETEYVAYVSEQNLLPDHSGEALRHTGIQEIFERDASGTYRMRDRATN